MNVYICISLYLSRSWMTLLQECFTIFRHYTTNSFHSSQALRCKMRFIILKHCASKCVSLYSKITLQNLFHSTQVLRYKVFFIILEHDAKKCVSLYSGITLLNVFHYTQALGCKVCFNLPKYVLFH